MKIQSILLFLILSGNLYIGNAQTPKVFNKEESTVYVPIITNKWGDFGTAKDYVLGEKVSGAVSDKVFFVVDLTAGVYRALLNFDTLRTGNVKLNLHIYDRPELENGENSTLITKSFPGSAPQDIVFFAPKNSKYYIVISLYESDKQSSSEYFDFTMSTSNLIDGSIEPNDSFEQSQTIQLNRKIGGRVNSKLDQTDYYRIRLQKGKTYSAQLKFDKSADLNLYLYQNPSYESRVGGSSTKNGSLEQIIFNTQDSEWYYILVAAFRTRYTHPYELIVNEQ